MKIYNGNNVTESDWHNNQTWESAEEESEFSILDLLDRDPDRLRMNGELSCYFTEIKGEIFYYSIGWASDSEIEKCLMLFFSDDYKERFKRTKNQTWDAFNALSSGIAYRGGSGYVYTIYEYFEAA